MYSTLLTALLNSQVFFFYLIQPNTHDKVVFQSLSCITYMAQWGKYDGHLSEQGRLILSNLWQQYKISGTCSRSQIVRQKSLITNWCVSPAALKHPWWLKLTLPTYAYIISYGRSRMSQRNTRQHWVKIPYSTNESDNRLNIRSMCISIHRVPYGFKCYMLQEQGNDSHFWG